MKALARPRSRPGKVMVAASVALCLVGCRFGTLSTSKCLQYYGQGAVEAASRARSPGPIEEAYGFCADGRARIDAMIPPLQAHGFQVDEPDNHFEVPGGWCLVAERPVSGGFDVLRSPETVCAIGDSSRAYLTGGSVTSGDGQKHVIFSTYDREAREALNKRVEQNRR